jgi:hypothetical protein
MDDDVRIFLEMMVRQGPIYLVLFASMIFAMARSDRYRAASLWTALGFGWLLLFGVVADVWREFRIYELLILDEWAAAPGRDLEWLVDALSCGFLAALQSIGLICFLMALHAGRSRRPPYRGVEADPEELRHNRTLE